MLMMSLSNIEKSTKFQWRNANDVRQILLLMKKSFVIGVKKNLPKRNYYPICAKNYLRYR